MSIFPRTLPLLTCAAIAACAAAHTGPGPQDPPRREPLGVPVSKQVTTARELLASKDPKKVAWGAWRASEAASPELAPDVVRAISAASVLPASSEHTWMLRSLCDAAVRTGAVPKPVDLLWLGREHGGLANTLAVLAGRAPAANVELLELWEREERGELWIASANLLAKAAPKVHAPKWLPLVKIAITVHVFDTGGSGPGGSTHSTGIGCGAAKAPDGFPPSVYYTLKRRLAVADDVFAPGPIPIAFERTVYREQSFGIGGRIGPVERGEYALRLLRWLADDRAVKGVLEPERSITHEWRDGGAYLRDVGERIEGFRAAWRALLAELRARDILDEATARTPAPFTITVEDYRALPREELPALTQ